MIPPHILNSQEENIAYHSAAIRHWMNAPSEPEEVCLDKQGELLKRYYRIRKMFALGAGEVRIYEDGRIDSK